MYELRSMPQFQPTAYILCTNRPENRSPAHKTDEALLFRFFPSFPFAIRKYNAPQNLEHTRAGFIAATHFHSGCHHDEEDNVYSAAFVLILADVGDILVFIIIYGITAFNDSEK